MLSISTACLAWIRKQGHFTAVSRGTLGRY